MEQYYIYLTTNSKRTHLFAGMTNDLQEELINIFLNKRSKTTFATKNSCFHLLYYEKTDVAHEALDRLRQVRHMAREEKENLIRSVNPMWKFLNSQLMKWPPENRVN